MIGIIYNSKKEKKICEDYEYAIKKIGSHRAKKLAMLIGAIECSIDPSDIAGLPQFRMHKLKGDKKECYSFSIDKKFRVEFYPLDENKNDLKSGMNEKEMFTKAKYIKILRITNHYE